MDRRTSDARQLMQLTQVALVAAQTRLAGLVRTETDLRAKLEALRPSRPPPGTDITSDPSTRAGADILWLRWAESRRTVLNQELARCLVAQAQAKAAVAKSFGRNEAIGGVYQKLRRAAHTAHLRRADRDGL